MGRETLCLVQDQFQGSCECPPWRIKNVVETLQGDTHENCICEFCGSPFHVSASPIQYLCLNNLRKFFGDL